MLDIRKYVDDFKPARPINYSAYVCKVPAGSAVLDPIRDNRVYALVGNKQVLTPLEVNEISKKDTRLYELIRGRLITNSAFIISIAGTISVITAQELMSGFEFPNGTAITQSRLLSKAYICEEQQGINTPVNITLNRAYKFKISNPENNIVMNWFKVVAKESTIEEEAMYIDRWKMPEFNQFLPSDNKDYLVVILDGEVSTAKFISVEDFKFKYDMHGWSKVLGSVKREESKQPKPLFTLTESIHGVKTFAVVIENLISDMSVDSLALKSGVVREFSTETLSRNAVAISYELKFGTCWSLAYKKDDKYCFAFASADRFEEFDYNLDEFISYLEKEHFVTLSLKDFKIYKELLVALFSLYNSSVIANYKMPMLSEVESQSIKEYTGIEYQNINMYLRDEEVPDAFNCYLHAMHISEYLDRCQVLKNSWHFRGLTIKSNKLPKEIKSGVVIPSKSFVSTTITSTASFDFAADAGKDETSFIFLFKNTAKKHGAFIDLLSAHRGNEYEVLYNVGSDFKLVKKLGYYHEEDSKPAEVWIVELVDNKDVGIRKYQYKQDSAEKLVAMIQMSDLMKAFYIFSVEEDTGVVKVILYRYNESNIAIYITLKLGVFKVEFSGINAEPYTFVIKEKGYNHLFDYLYRVLNTQDLSSSFNPTALSSFSEQFMLNLLSTFIANNFIISSQKVNIGYMMNPLFGEEFLIPEMKEQEEVRTSEFTILTAEMKTLRVEISLKVLKDSAEIEASIKASVDKGRILTKIVTKPIKERDTLFYAVYETLVHKFSLDPTRRLRHVFSLVSGYYEKFLEFEGSNGVYKVMFDDKVFDVTLSGVVIHVSYEGSSIDLNYYDDIYTLASQIQTLI